MIRRFLLERISWILLIAGLQLLALFMAFVDQAVPLTSVLYYTFLSSILVILFLFIRYRKETPFYVALEERDNDLDLTTFPEADSPFEAVIERNVCEQMEQLKQEASRNQILLEQEKDELLSWIHEVKTPLTAMQLIIDRLNDYKLKSQLTFEWMRIHFLLDQQLHQKRIPFIENDLYIEEVNLEPLVFNEIKSLKSWCMQKGIGFDIDLQAEKVLSDAKWLSFILRQLLTNAIKYSGPSEITLASVEQDGRIHLTIQDEGRGIDPRDLPRIFEKGFTSTADHQDKAATGMGLYLTDRIRQALKITFNVDSRLGEGTTFTLVFPKENEFTKLRSM
ncbi:two-component system, OmpR family, bacitracin resistance sensor histidine kinase BceS [Halobacillus karajensis]|uniref:histidine kinase n=1 Tax=Halobacillus karajensis TaxID=195088 RepID=A0A059NXC4_9BACI|nr:sensor histidine kinase [Halobacillus karajensis]CDQ18545.1 Sensor histidine kinase GraS [Halobacillus karajensis]CDQ23383.1 Sensor histidine kinase GraS [Halobacillus karajensis]CDQ26865.1 Sensor histidine kinase GraS [Halobacillus karajensis]SEH50109.1 two-component system, OmpR family, bacitracin resistance sensor histidine kinase BceS [Halobacillus karajensis]